MSQGPGEGLTTPGELRQAEGGGSDVRLGGRRAILGRREQFVHDVTACDILGDWPVVPCGWEFRIQGGRMN